MAIALLLGIWFVVIGVVRVGEALSRSERHRVWDLVVAVLEVIAGVIIVSDARIGVATLALIVGIGFILRGVFYDSSRLAVARGAQAPLAPGRAASWRRRETRHKPLPVASRVANGNHALMLGTGLCMQLARERRIISRPGGETPKRSRTPTGRPD